MRKFQILILLTFFCQFVLAGTDGTIRGRVTDENGEGLPGVMVYLEGTTLGSVSDESGNYFLLNIPVGAYNVIFQMMGYKTVTIQNIDIIMDQTLWLNQNMELETIESDEIIVTGQRALVEHDITGTKQTVSGEAIKALPLKDVTELYSLQSGVVKVESKQQGIPGHEERGLEEVHVRGGRSGEIGYMIDGMYIKNPVFGGIGIGTRMNLFAIKEFDFQPGGFSSEYGDANSAVSNYHTTNGTDDFSLKFKYETSAFGGEYGKHKAYNDFNLGFGGRVPLPETAGKLFYWVSGQNTDQKYRVLKFDDKVFIPNDFNNNNNRDSSLMVQPFDVHSGFRDFGFEKVGDIFTKITYNPTNTIRTNFSYWNVNAHRKRFDPSYLYWYEGQNELFRNTERWYFEFNHSLSQKTFYNLRLAHFKQDQFQGVRWTDSDQDGFPNWFEWRYPAGSRSFSDPYNADIVPHYIDQGQVVYIQKDEKSGWYYGADPGNYDWSKADPFTDANGNGIWDFGEECECSGENGEWIVPSAKSAIEMDGSYWLTPEMYINSQSFTDESMHETDLLYSDPYMFFDPSGQVQIPEKNDFLVMNFDSLYYIGWDEGKIFGGSDYYYNESVTYTNEIKFDITSQLTDKWKARLGIGYKSHLLNFYEVQAPYLNTKPEDFSEDFKDFGLDNIAADFYLEDDWVDLYGLTPSQWISENNYENNSLYDIDVFGNITVEPDEGEGDGKWNIGEEYSDLNGNNKYDRGREPEEITFYLNNTIEVPWMVINAGIRFDLVNYNTRMWADPSGEISPYTPYVYFDHNGNDQWDSELFHDCGQDRVCVDDPDLQDPGEGNGVRDFIEVGDEIVYLEELMEPMNYERVNHPKAKVLFTNTNYTYKISPRLGFSHVITDKSNFTFNYGIYYQNPIYRNVFINTGQLEDPTSIFEQSVPLVGNASMTASRTIMYEFGVNVQVGRNFAYSVIGWAKDMDQMLTTEKQYFNVFSYNVFRNYDYGSAKGIDINLEQRGHFVNTMVQYTISLAKANRSYDWEAYSKVNLGEAAPTQETLQSYDRTHDLALTLYTQLPFGIRMGVTGFYQSGYPYTPQEWQGTQLTSGAKNSKRGPEYKDMNLTFSKYMALGKTKVSLGLSIYNVLNIENALDIYYTTGEPLDPGPEYMENVSLPIFDGSKSNSYYDTPWRLYAPRQINAHIKFEFN